MNEEIQAIRYDVEDIGKHVKSSKKRFSWTFGLNGRNHTIILDFSFISGKVKLIMDRKTILETELPAGTSFQHPFTLDGFALNILQQGENFELRINNKVFSHLYNQAKTNTEFRNYEDEVKDIKVNEGSFQNNSKTVKLNIGAFGGMKKKVKNAAESENWGDFGGDIGIPSYFGDSTSSSQSEKVQTQVKPKTSLLDGDSEIKIVNKKVEVEEVDFFANDNSVQVSTSPSEQHLQNIMNQQPKDDFNTMQNMFTTMNIQQTQNQNKPQESSLDLLNSSSVGIEQVNSGGEYSTMQNLFATQAQGQSTLNFNNPNFLTNPNPQQQNVTLNQSPLEYNTMQNMFATGINVGANVNSPSTLPNLSDFNTMQNFFASQSGVIPPINQVSSANTQAQSQFQTQNQPQSQPVNFQTNSAFNTMQNMFSTQQGGVTLTQVQTSQQTVQVGQVPNEFNTMQNMFATGVQNTPTFNNIGSLPTNSLQNVDIQDFSTMQNLFKTGSGIAMPPPNEIKTQDPFTLLSDTETSKTVTTTTNYNQFNTYSGPKTTGTSEIDLTAFGTMQKGQGQEFNLDFTKNANLNQGVPNFSKKKAPTDDLI